MKKILVVLLLAATFSHCHAMEQVKAAVAAQAADKQSEQYKKALYAQFCAAQEVKKEYLELAKGPWSHDRQIQVIGADEFLVTYYRWHNNIESTKNGLYFVSGTCYGGCLILPIGHWKFIDSVSIEGTTSVEGYEIKCDLNDALIKKFNAQYHEKRGNWMNYGGRKILWTNDIYKITKTIDDKPIPEVESLMTTEEQANELWQQMKEYYEREKIKSP